MFERFTDDARAVVVGAQTEARALGHHWLGTEHVLLALVARSGSPVAAVLARLGVTELRVRERVAAELGVGPADDATALADLGIDLEEVRRRAEQRFGPGALDDAAAPARGPRRLFRRARSCPTGPPTGHIPFTRRAKKSLELAVREALAAHSREIREEHLLLGLVRAEGLAGRVVHDLGVPVERLRAALKELGEAA